MWYINTYIAIAIYIDEYVLKQNSLNIYINNIYLEIEIGKIKELFIALLKQNHIYIWQSIYNTIIRI